MDDKNQKSISTLSEDEDSLNEIQIERESENENRSQTSYTMLNVEIEDHIRNTGERNDSVIQHEEEEHSSEGWQTVKEDNSDASSQDEDHPDTSLRHQVKDITIEKEAEIIKGCVHYDRLCQIIAPCCNEVFWCRHCHNDVTNTVEPNMDFKKLHEIDRFKVEEIICCRCSTRQKVSNQCENCQIEFASYFCDKCKFWDNNGKKKKLFHCDGCGLCRVGGRENYFHCPTCGSCYPSNLENNHICVERAMHTACPICLEDMFTSIRVVTVLQCGHTIHQDCYYEMSSSDPPFSIIRCPLCSQSVESNDAAWRVIDAVISETPMPPEHQRDAYILCNDCQGKCHTSFHFYGLKCLHCGSYNAVEINPPGPSS